MRDRLPGRKVDMLKAERLVCVSWKPLLRITPFPDGTFDCHWNPKILQGTGINKDEVVEALESILGVAGDPIDWQL